MAYWLFASIDVITAYRPDCTLLQKHQFNDDTDQDAELPTCRDLPLHGPHFAEPMDLTNTLHFIMPYNRTTLSHQSCTR